MMTRDRHLLRLIEQQLAERHSVLVVYGGSHWATLSAALQERLGSPKSDHFSSKFVTGSPARPAAATRGSASLFSTWAAIRCGCLSLEKPC
jgi:hypothetical protein